MTFFVKSTVLQFWKQVKNPPMLNRVMRVAISPISDEIRV